MPKYNVGDKVKFLDLHKSVRYGTITEVTMTIMSDWNKKEKPLYMVTHCPYLRFEEEILGLCED